MVSPKRIGNPHRLRSVTGVGMTTLAVLAMTERAYPNLREEPHHRLVRADVKQEQRLGKISWLDQDRKIQAAKRSCLWVDQLAFGADKRESGVPHADCSPTDYIPRRSGRGDRHAALPACLKDVLKQHSAFRVVNVWRVDAREPFVRLGSCSPRADECDHSALMHGLSRMSRSIARQVVRPLDKRNLAILVEASTGSPKAP